MKGVEAMLMLIIQLVFGILIGLVIFLVLIQPFLASNDRAVNLLNVQMLASYIDEACATGTTFEIDKFELRQSMPLNIPLLPDQSDPVYKFLLRQHLNQVSPDPQYMLYYEAFPPGEGVGWETGTNLYYRVLVPTYSSNVDELPDLIDSVKQEFALKKAGEDVEKTKFFINNIVLTTDLDLSTGLPVEEETTTGAKYIQNVGEWKDETTFEYSNFLSMSIIDKSLTKYMPCGAYSLCYKIDDTVYVFPLENCRRSGIKYIEMFDDSGRVPIIHPINLIPGEGPVEGPSWLLSDLYHDFSIASPCKASLKIEKTECVCKGSKNGMLGIHADCLLEAGVFDWETCWDNTDRYPFLKYPIYEYEDGELKRMGEHYFCTNRISGTEPIPNDCPENPPTIECKTGIFDCPSGYTKLSEYTNINHKGCGLFKQCCVKNGASLPPDVQTMTPVDCIKITVNQEDGSGYCRSINDKSAKGLFPQSPLRKTFHPVTDSTDFLSDNDAVVLEPTKELQEAWPGCWGWGKNKPGQDELCLFWGGK
jgi:hypothetical protein